jgi:hypothetical protein
MDSMTNDEFKAAHPWGSVQYDSAREWYDRYFREAQDGEPPSERLKKLGFEMDIDHTVFNRDFSKKRREVHQEFSIEEEDDEAHGLIDQAVSADDLFKVLRDEGWDLWGAAPFIASLWGIDITDQRKDPPTEEGSNGLPLINQMVIDGMSADTGLYCAILKDLGIVSDESCFEDFST